MKNRMNDVTKMGTGALVSELLGYINATRHLRGRRLSLNDQTKASEFAKELYRRGELRPDTIKWCEEQGIPYK